MTVNPTLPANDVNDDDDNRRVAAIVLDLDFKYEVRFIQLLLRRPIPRPEARDQEWFLCESLKYELFTLFIVISSSHRVGNYTPVSVWLIIFRNLLPPLGECKL